MTLPRQVFPDRFYQITRRTMQKQYLLHPDDETRETFRFCLQRAAERHRIDVMGYCSMSNHYHAVIYDRFGNYPAFLELFHVLLARSINALRGRTDCFWSSSQTSVQWLPDVATIVDKLVYTFTNPVKHCVVERIEQWTGANGYGSFMSGTPARVNRPKFFFKKGKAASQPPQVVLTMVIPAVLGNPDAFRSRVQRAIDLRLIELAQERRDEGKRIIGLSHVIDRGWRYIPEDKPLTRADRIKVSPTYASKDPEVRRAVSELRNAFLDNYRTARRAWLAQEPYKFPLGTYWLARHARVRVIEPIFNFDDADEA
ncbi:MAG TPA: hypothetical protein VFQ53_42880 [Kofleriaceae bacterium]|nr:hypothetical protein [Kofleriaceae bacterium]